MSDDNAAIMQQTYEAFGRGDIPAVLSAMDENIDWTVPAVLPHAMPVENRDDVARFFQKLDATWDDFNLEIEDVCASGDRVCMIGHAGGTLNGTPASFRFIHAWTLRDGVAVKFDEYVDPTGLGAG